MKKMYYIIALVIFIWGIFGATSFATDNNEDLEIMRLDRSGMIPSFNKDITEYYMTIGNHINNIEITAIPENKEASVQILGNNDLKEGINKIEIIVTSKDKTNEKKYTINLTETSDTETANTNLENLAIENVTLSPEFHSNTTQYNAEVSNTVKSLNILAIPENAKAQIIIEGNENLKEGNNVITIKVIAQNNITERVYKINLYKRNNGEEAEEKQEQEAKIARVSAILEKNEIDNNQEEQMLNKGNKDNIIIATLITFFIILIIVIIRNQKNDGTA